MCHLVPSAIITLIHNSSRKPEIHSPGHDINPLSHAVSGPLPADGSRALEGLESASGFEVVLAGRTFFGALFGVIVLNLHVAGTCKDA